MECLVLGKPIQFLNLVMPVFTPESKGSDHYNLGFLRTYSVPGCVLGSRDIDVNEADGVLIASLPV